MTPELHAFTGVVERVSSRRWRWVLIKDGSALASQYGTSESEGEAEAKLHGFLFALFGDEYISTTVSDADYEAFLNELEQGE